RHCSAADHALYGARVDAPLADFAIDRAIAPPNPGVDIALLHTSQPMPIGLHGRRHARDTQPPLGEARVVGFGVSDFSTGAGYGIKRQMFVHVQGWGCDGSRPQTTGCIPGTEMVLPPDRARDTCHGDSGGAVL